MAVTCKAPFREDAERLTAPLRSGALTGHAHARTKLAARFGMSLSAPAGQSLPSDSPPPGHSQDFFRGTKKARASKGEKF
jgi:hypothetical protein